MTRDEAKAAGYKLARTHLWLDFDLKPYGYQKQTKACVHLGTDGIWCLYRTDGYTGLMTLTLCTRDKVKVRHDLRALGAKRGTLGSVHMWGSYINEEGYYRPLDEPT